MTINNNTNTTHISNLGTHAPPAFSVPGSQTFYYLSPDALMAFVEEELRNVDQKIFKNMDEIKVKNDLAEKLSTASSSLERMKTLAVEPKATEYCNKVYGSVNGIPASPGNATTNGAAAPGFTPPDFEVRAEHFAMVEQLKETAQVLRAQGFETEATHLEQMAESLEQGNLGVSGMKDQLESAVGTLSKVGQTLSRSNELTMINLQQSMERRSRVLTFVSNALKAMDGPMDQAVRNMV